MSEINLRVTNKRLNGRTNELAIFLEPIDQNKIEEYLYHIRCLKKEFKVEEIEQDLHFMYYDQIKEAFLRYSGTKRTLLLESLYFMGEMSI